MSGGADSTALMHMVAAWLSNAEAGESRPEVIVLTIDHGLRPASAGEARVVASQAEALGLPHRILPWRGEKPATGIQAAARDARYRLLVDWCRRHGAACLVTGHTGDDQAETMLMRLAHGSGVDGLAGMAAASELDGVTLLRPLLDLSRPALRHALTARGVPFIDDPSNEDERFERVRIRRKLADFAEVGVTPQSLARTAARLRDAACALDHFTDELIARSCTLHGGGFALVERAALQDVPREIVRRVLERAVKVIGGRTYPLRYESLADMAGRLTRGCDLDRTAGGCRLVTRNDRLYVVREWGRMDQARHPLADGMIWDNRLRVVLSSAVDAEATIGAVGAVDWPRLRAARTELAAIPAFIGRTLPAIRRGGEVLVPYLGARLDKPDLSLHFVGKELMPARLVERFSGEPL